MRAGIILLLVIFAGHPSLRAGGLPHFDRVYLVFAEEHSHDFISGFGHVYVVLGLGESEAPESLLLRPAVNFGADISPLGKGPFVGRYEIRDCHELVRKNQAFDQRRLFFAELSIPEGEIEILRESLSNRLDKDFTYDFLRRNCGHYLADWLCGSDTAEAFYQTPRESFAKILRRHPPARMLSIAANVEILERALRDKDDETRRKVKAALREPATIPDIGDPLLELIAIDIASSRANRLEYELLVARRADLLSAADAKSVAKSKSEVSRMAAADKKFIVAENEGPAFALSVISREGKLGFSLEAEAGLRDLLTAPRPEHILRETTFLRIKNTVVGNIQDTSATLAAISTIRDFSSALGGGSSGANLGYHDRVDTHGEQGVHVSAWSGIYTRRSNLWYGFATSVLANDLESKACLIFSPLLDFLYSGENGWLARLRVSMPDLDEFCHSVSAERMISEQLLVRFTADRNPRGETTFSLSTTFRW